MTAPGPADRLDRLSLYDVGADVRANRAGPRGILPWVAVGDRTVSPQSRSTLFGRRVRGVVGIPACPLTANASWVSAMAGAGFDILTTKTVRSVDRPAHPFPQWLLGTAVPAEGDPGADADVGPGIAVELGGPGPVSSANSFGVPSPDPTVWRADLQRCRRVLAPGQVLIASVMGSPELYSGTDLVTDFVRVARLAAETGVEAVELNLSCPNTLHADGSGANAPLCADPDAVSAVVGAVRLALPATVAVVAKLAVLPPAVLHDVVGRLAPHVQAVAGINAVQRRVVDAAGGPAFGAERQRAGVSGAAVREQGLDFVRSVHRRRAELGASFDILGMGGVLTVADVVAFRAAGADIVQSATGACLDPHLANESRRFR